ncbi:MAG: hypothetical protein GC138_08035 [Gammaproteobacteria bacterium]|nr:hypothetical protein [Gammaproteobacteria bacterium]
MNGELSIWEQITLVVVAVGVIFLFRPGIKRAMEESRQAENKDWKGVLIPIGLVILFVIFLIMIT